MDQYQEPISITDVLGIVTEAGIHKDMNSNMAINIDVAKGETYGQYTAYFKVYDSAHVDRADKVARITILDPTYVIHSGPKKKWELFGSERKKLDKIMHITILDPTYVIHSGPKKKWELSGSERKKLDKIMHSRPSGQYSGYSSVWAAVAGEFEKIYRSMTGISLNFGTNIPDFKTIKPDPSGKPKNR